MYSKLLLGLCLTAVVTSASATVTISGTKDYAGATVGTACDGQSESQQPVFLIKDGGILKNVVIKAGGAADGIHCEGNCTLTNVKWPDVCEDAATMKGGSGKVMTISGGSASKAEDKVFQHNGKGSTIKLSNFTTTDTIGKLWQSCGNCENNGGPRYLNLNTVSINGKVSSYLLRLNSNYNDKATVRNLKIKDYKVGSPKVCVQAIGVQPGEKQVNNGEFWNTASCDISKTDVTKL